MNDSTPAIATGDNSAVQTSDATIITSTLNEASHFKLQVLEVYTHIFLMCTANATSREVFKRCDLCAVLLSSVMQLYDRVLTYAAACSLCCMLHAT
jgi:hypothetical protein